MKYNNRESISKSSRTTKPGSQPTPCLYVRYSCEKNLAVECKTQIIVV